MKEFIEQLNSRGFKVDTDKVRRELKTIKTVYREEVRKIEVKAVLPEGMTFTSRKWYGSMLIDLDNCGQCVPPQPTPTLFLAKPRLSSNVQKHVLPWHFTPLKLVLQLLPQNSTTLVVCVS